MKSSREWERLSADGRARSRREVLRIIRDTPRTIAQIARDLSQRQQRVHDALKSLRWSKHCIRVDDDYWVGIKELGDEIKPTVWDPNAKPLEHLGRPVTLPTECKIGGADRVTVYALRYEMGLPIFNRGDNKDTDPTACAKAHNDFAYAAKSAGFDDEEDDLDLL